MTEKQKRIAVTLIVIASAIFLVALGIVSIVDGALFADIVIADAVRYVVSGGASTVLFLPACIPVCFMVIMFYSFKDTARDKSTERKNTFLVGAVLLLLSLYFEIATFL